VCTRKSFRPCLGGEKIRGISVAPQWNGMQVFCERKALRKAEVQQGMRGLKFWVLFSCHPRSQVAVCALV